MAGLLDYPLRSKPGEPIWELARLYPTQGDWSEDSYLALETNLLIEYHNGTLEFLPMPTKIHQMIVMELVKLLLSWADKNGGKVFGAPMRLKVADRQYREPDAMLVLDPSRDTESESYFNKADLVVEVVSKGAENRKRDYKAKRQEYAKAGIPEYWIVDPIEKRITVLTLKRGKYAAHSEVGPGDTAESALLGGFAVSVDTLFVAK